ncbi:hypothetical protein CJF31_00003181 [Rutstroemia sp. NJR-2017a BVV2]|nr:hypothetical protein CJF31_00001973 [Rutstroemia sp. NJR-2017a BVV2]PQE18512.1 hypothetical protein CJF31_00003181 [Rutstroemia sp. NJR-2017a BVV2]
MSYGTMRNPKYHYSAERVTVERDTSALLGVRGAFDMLRHVHIPITDSFQCLEIHRRWYELVGHYSARKLTMKTDKMMAIAGLGFTIHRSTGMRFLAGLWEEVLPFNLLWVSTGECEPRPVRDVPSWSWASVDRIINEMLYETSIAEIKSLKVFIDIVSIESLLEHNSLVHNAKLRVSGHITLLDESRICFIPDIILEDSDAEYVHVPILSFTNQLGSLEVHGVVLREKDGAESSFERVGYFWTRDQLTTKTILDLTKRKTTFSFI